jgi:hypothetical protein
MHNLTDFEWLSLFALFVAWTVNPFDGKWFGGKKARRRYRDLKTSLIKIPSYILSVTWFVMFCVVATSMFLYLNFSRQKIHDRTLYDATLAIGLIVNYFLVKTLYYVLINRGYYLWSVAHAVLVCLSACAVEVLIWIHFGNNENNIAAGILYGIYVVWTVVTIIGTIDIAYNNTSKSFFGFEEIDPMETDDDPEMMQGNPPVTSRIHGRNGWNRRLQQRQRRRMGV